MKNIILNHAIRTLIALTIVFVSSRIIIRALPGDPVDAIISESALVSDSKNAELFRQEIAKELGLDLPFIVSLARDAKNGLQGNFGRSLTTRTPVAPVILDRILHTSMLALLVILISIPIALLVGLWPGAIARSFCLFYSSFTAALPSAWAGLLFALIFGVWLQWLPVVRNIALPAITLALLFAGGWARLIRERVREQTQEGTSALCVTAARARGISEYKIILKYSLAPASGSLLAYIGTQLGGLLAGAAVTETLFNWPGIGSLLVESLLRRDFPVIEAAVFFTACFCLLGNRLGDFLQWNFDPRQKFANKNRDSYI